MPTMSCVETRLSHASRAVGLLVRLVMPRFTMAAIRSGRGRKASVALRSSTMTTRASGPLRAVVNGSVAEQIRGSTMVSDSAATMQPGLCFRISPNVRGGGRERGRGRTTGRAAFIPRAIATKQNAQNEFRALIRRFVSSAFLDTSGRECYHHRQCSPQKIGRDRKPEARGREPRLRV